MAASLYVLRVVDALSLSLASASIALALSDQQGVTAYSQFVSVSVMGGALGGLTAFITLNLLRQRAPAPVSAVLSGIARLVLAFAFGENLAGAMPLLYAMGFLLTLTSIMLMSMFHSLTSITSAGMRARTGLLAASATGGLLGAPLAGAVVASNLGGLLITVQIVGAMAGLTVALRFHRAFSKAPLPALRARLPKWRLMGPIAWRVPLIAGLSFSLGSLAPGVLTDLWGPQVGGFAGTAYLTGAVAAAGLLRALDGSRRRQISEALRSHRWWFLPASLGTLLWLFMLGPIWVSLLATLCAGVVLHLVQAGFEQATADIGDAEDAGPNIVVLHSMAGLATAASLTVMPRAIELLGLSPVVIGIALALGSLALRDSVLARAARPRA